MGRRLWTMSGSEPGLSLDGCVVTYHTKNGDGTDDETASKERKALSETRWMNREHEWSPRWRCNERKSWGQFSRNWRTIRRTRSYELMNAWLFLIVKPRKPFNFEASIGHRGTFSRFESGSARIERWAELSKDGGGSCDNRSRRFTVNNVIVARHLSRVYSLLF